MIVKTSSYTRLKTSDFVVYAQRCVRFVSSKPDVYHNMEPPVQVVDDAVQVLQAKLANDATRVQKNERDAQRKIVTAYLSMWAARVSAIAAALPTRQQKISIIRAAGFEPAYATGYPRVKMTAVRSLRASSLSQGVHLRFGRVKGAKTYVVLKQEGYATEHSEWRDVKCVTQCSVIIPCKPAEIASFKVYPVGTAGKGPDSVVVTCLAGL